MIQRLFLLLRLFLHPSLAFLRCRTLRGGFHRCASLRPARFLRYRSRRSHAAHSRRGSRFFCAAALRGNWALRSALFRRTCSIRPRGRARGRTGFALGSRRCRRWRRGCRMLPICRASIHACSAGRLRRTVGLLGSNMILLRDLGVSIRGNVCRLLHGLGITPADGRALCSCCTGYWRILRAA